MSEFEQKFEDVIPAAPPVEETVPEDGAQPDVETFNDEAVENGTGRKGSPFSIGFFVLCFCVIAALVTFIRSILYFFG